MPQEDHVFDDSLPLSAERIAPGEYIITAKDGRKLGYIEGRSLAEWFCASINSRAELLAVCEAILADCQDADSRSRLAPVVGHALCAAINKAKGVK